MEEQFKIRSKEDHKKFCGYNDNQSNSISERDHYSKVYGINRSTILMQLPDFDVTQQLPQDLMHVVLEGVFPIHMEELLNYMVEESFLRIAQINCRLSAFPFAYFHVKPTPLSNCELQGMQSGILPKISLATFKPTLLFQPLRCGS